MRSFKKIAAMILAVAMLCSFTALGASVTLTDPTITEGTLEFDVTTEDASQVSVIAYQGAGNVVYIDQLVANSSIPAIDLGTNYGEYTVIAGGIGVDTAIRKTVTYEAPEIVTYDVTLSDVTNGTVSYDAASLKEVEAGDTINFTFVPYMGYELTSLMVGGTEKVSEAGDGTYALVVEADTTVTATFSEIEVVGNDVVMYGKNYDIAADAATETPASKLFFGQALGENVVSMGMYVEVKDGDDWIGFKTSDDPETPGNESVGPYFAASNAKIAAGNKYGIRFFSFLPGTYKVSAYYETAEAGKVVNTDTAVEFTVEQ